VLHPSQLLSVGISSRHVGRVPLQGLGVWEGRVQGAESRALSSFMLGDCFFVRTSLIAMMKYWAEIPLQGSGVQWWMALIALITTIKIPPLLYGMTKTGRELSPHQGSGVQRSNGNDSTNFYGKDSSAMLRNDHGTQQ